MNSWPEARICPSCAFAAKSKARASRSRSTSCLYASTSASSSSTRSSCRSTTAMNPVYPRLSQGGFALSPRNHAGPCSRVSPGCSPSWGWTLRGVLQRRRLFLEQVPEGRRLEQASPGSVSQLELAEDLPRLLCPGVFAGAPLLREPVAQLVETLGGVEDAAHDELGRDDAVPPVILEPHGEVVAPFAQEPVELRTQAERDRRPGVPAALPHAETQVLPVAHGRQVRELAAVDEQRDRRIAEPERL